ncbi:MAG: hypothetical protein DME26_05705, partial [Verrucomicrobia bacterium]
FAGRLQGLTCAASALEDAKSDEEKQELERIWREAELAPGRTAPGLSSSDCAEKVFRYYHFPL